MYSNSVYKIPKYNVYHNPSKRIIKEGIDEKELIHLLATMYEKGITKVRPTIYQVGFDFVIGSLINAVEAEGNIIIHRLISSM
ncbi:hypothetical protein [Staphylococcus virus vB_SurM-PSU2]|nr:hypothetical protein [Staphylococcus virus vB_SurM-PSU2]